MEKEAPTTSAYAMALVVTIVCLALGNLIIGYFGGLANLQAGTPAAAALSLVQGLAGALLAGFASRQLFRSLRPADFWLKWIVIVAAAVFAVVIVWLLVVGKSERAMNWTTYSGLAGLVGTELGRRLAKTLFRPSAAGDSAISPSRLKAGLARATLTPSSAAELPMASRSFDPTAPLKRDGARRSGGFPAARDESPATRCLRLALPFAAALLALPPAASANARPGTAATAPDAERQAKGLKLAQTVQPREIAVTQSLAALDRQMVDTLLSDPEMKEMEAEYPGIVRAMYLAVRPILAADLEKSLPGLWRELAQVYARRLTSPQLEEATTFFQGSTGRKFLREMTGNMEIKALTRDIIGPGDGTIGAGSYTEALKGAAGATIDALTPAEQTELNRFQTSPVGKALEDIAPETMRVGLAWMNRPDPESDARTEAAMIAAVEAFIEKHSAPAPKRAAPKGK